MVEKNESIETWRSGTDPEHHHKDKEGSGWEERDGQVLAPVAGGTVDTSEGVGVDWRGMARYTSATHLAFPLEWSTHFLVDMGNGFTRDV